MAWLPAMPAQVLVCGGGRHNAAIMDALKQFARARPAVEAIGLNGDMLEAQALRLAGGARAAGAAHIGADDHGSSGTGLRRTDQSPTIT